MNDKEFVDILKKAMVKTVEIIVESLSEEKIAETISLFAEKFECIEILNSANEIDFFRFATSCLCIEIAFRLEDYGELRLKETVAKFKGISKPEEHF